MVLFFVVDNLCLTHFAKDNDFLLKMFILYYLFLKKEM